ncbi:Eae protein [Escherichia coli]|uniref:Eae protein n=1 Tax=Escherichia coli TaxID=562 RepID=UPI00385FED7F
MKQVSLIEMDGFLKGKCIPSDLKVNETNAEYLVRKFDEVRAEARNEGINYTASRLAAAFNHGFINKSLREVFDVTRMILSAKEELANEPHPIDGLSGEYAEKSLEEWAEQIRKGVQS